MRAISDRIDTSAIAVDTDSLDSQSEGAGAGYGVEHFTGAAIAERGRGRVRVYHVFNPLPHARAELVELTVWDWPYDWKRLRLRDAGGAPLPFQVVDRVSQHYWSHDYFRVLVQVEAPAGGYTTVVLEEAPAGQPCVYRNDRDRILLPAAPLVLENEALRAAFDPESGMLLSLLDKAAGQERVDSAQGAGFQVKLAEPNSMSAWVIGRHVQSVPVVTMRVRPLEGSLRQGLVVEQRTLGSTLKATVTLDPTATGLAYDLEVDWHEVSGGDRLVPVLTFGVPLNAAPDTVRMDIPAGSVDRAQRADDLPGLTHAAAVYGGRALALVTDCKYGYRAQADVLSATLINTASFPDPYPERGIHHVKLWLHAGAGDPAALKQAAQRYTRPLAYISATAHEGPLPAAASLLAVEAEGAVVTSAGVTEDGALLVRLYEASGKAGQASMALPFAPRRAVLVDLDERETGSATVEGGMVRVAIKPYQVLAVKVYADA